MKNHFTFGDNAGKTLESPKDTNKFQNKLAQIIQQPKVNDIYQENQEILDEIAQKGDSIYPDEQTLD